jgi:hypothetical protein
LLIECYGHTRHRYIIPTFHPKIRPKNLRRLDLELPDAVETILGVAGYDGGGDGDSLAEPPLIVLVVDAAEDMTRVWPGMFKSDGLDMIDDLVEDVARVDPAIS